MLIDTHTHLYLPEFRTTEKPDGPADAVRRALDAGVGKMIFPNVDLSTIQPMRALHEQFPSETFMAMGFHPTEVKEDWQDQLSVVLKEFEANRRDYIAIGEIGVDLYWDKTFEQQQMEAFDLQVALAVEAGLPIIIHQREALDQTLEVLKGHPGVRGVMHSFGGTVEDVDKIRKVADMYFGINGIVTFKNSRLREVLPSIGLDRIILETDSPYLAPVPRRGRRNESAYLIHTAAHVAASLGVIDDEIASRTTANAARLFSGITLD